jgi:hypothetical protein
MHGAYNASAGLCLRGAQVFIHNCVCDLKNHGTETAAALLGACVSTILCEGMMNDVVVDAFSTEDEPSVRPYDPPRPVGS